MAEEKDIIFSCKNSKVTTSCWTTIARRMLDPTKKDTHIQGQSRIPSKMVSEWVNEVAQSCPTLCDPIDCSLPGSSIHGIFQARVLEWVAIFEIAFRIKPNTHQRCSEGSKKALCAPGHKPHRDWARVVFESPAEVQARSGLPQAGALGAIWSHRLRHKPSCRSPLTP